MSPPLIRSNLEVPTFLLQHCLKNLYVITMLQSYFSKWYGKPSLTYVQNKFVPQSSLCAPFIWLCALFIPLCTLSIIRFPLLCTVLMCSFHKRQVLLHMHKKYYCTKTNMADNKMNDVLKKLGLSDQNLLRKRYQLTLFVIYL